MRTKTLSSVAAIMVGLSLVVMPVAPVVATGHGGHEPAWALSRGTLPIGKDHATGLKLTDHTVMWVGGDADDPADNNRTFVYDIRTQLFRETAPVPAAKRVESQVIAGVLADGSVVLTGGIVSDPANSKLSYRYDPRRDRWTRTGDLPEPQQWLWSPAVRLRDGRLLVAGGSGLDGLTGESSLKAFVFNPRHNAWDYTRNVKNHRVTTLGTGHGYGNAVLLRDGRVFMAGGSSFYDYISEDGRVVVATGTDFFDPRTGLWKPGPPLPPVPGEDDRIAGSHGGRAIGPCVSVTDDGKVIIAGGESQTDGGVVFENSITRRSVLVLSPAKDPARSTFRLSPHKIPSGIGHGGLIGDDGRSQLPCYAVSGHRLVLSGGQNSFGEDLFDTYIMDTRSLKMTRGPDRVHQVAVWAQDPASGYPPDYQTATISTRGVAMINSRLVFNGRTLVHGGAYDGVGPDFLGTRYAEQVTLR